MASEFLIFIPIALVPLVLFGVFYLIFYLTRAKMRHVRSQALTTLPGGGTNVPMLAAFSGWKHIPWITFSYNSLNPRFILHDREVEYRVLGLRRKPYVDISRIDLRTTIGTVNVVLEFKGSLCTFIANVVSRPNAAGVLAILKEKGCPLSRRAEVFLANEGSAAHLRRARFQTQECPAGRSQRGVLPESRTGPPHSADSS